MIIQGGEISEHVITPPSSLPPLWSGSILEKRVSPAVESRYLAINRMVCRNTHTVWPLPLTALVAGHALLLCTNLAACGAIPWSTRLENNFGFPRPSVFAKKLKDSLSHTVEKLEIVGII